MPPEQARGCARQGRPALRRVRGRSDALHAAHRSRALRPARELGRSTATILAKVIAGPPNPVRRISPSVPEELIAICEKAMARRPRHRYPEHGRDGRRPARLPRRVAWSMPTRPGPAPSFANGCCATALAATVMCSGLGLALLALSSLAVVTTRSNRTGSRLRTPSSRSRWRRARKRAPKRFSAKGELETDQRRASERQRIAAGSPRSRLPERGGRRGRDDARRRCGGRPPARGS